MSKILKRISWLTRRWNLSVNILSLYLHDNNNSWGFKLFEVKHNFYSYTLLGLDFRLPNGAEVKYLVVDHFDIFFLNRPLNKWAMKYDDDKMWGRVYTNIDELKYKIITTIFK
ncbi:hypothetical protein OAC50_00575 [bacterium]|jgi:hypothetical protein|nr:hypothetical protein [bacterium]|tara:strand:+ start:125 stop:463 length:339 start_codon:yes stop_codon:yes gene_type:complete